MVIYIIQLIYETYFKNNFISAQDTNPSHLGECPAHDPFNHPIQLSGSRGVPPSNERCNGGVKLSEGPLTRLLYHKRWEWEQIGLGQHFKQLNSLPERKYSMCFLQMHVGYWVRHCIETVKPLCSFFRRAHYCIFIYWQYYCITINNVNMFSQWN